MHIDQMCALVSRDLATGTKIVFSFVFILNIDTLTDNLTISTLYQFPKVLIFDCAVPSLWKSYAAANLVSTSVVFFVFTLNVVFIFI